MGGFRSETVTLKSDCKLLFACKQTSAEGKVSIALPCLFTADAVTGIFFSLSFKFSLRAVENDFFFGILNRFNVIFIYTKDQCLIIGRHYFFCHWGRFFCFWE